MNLKWYIPFIMNTTRPLIIGLGIVLVLGVTYVTIGVTGNFARARVNEETLIDGRVEKTSLASSSRVPEVLPEKLEVTAPVVPPVCDEIYPEATVFNAELLEVSLPKNLVKNEHVRVVMSFKNTGDVKWYGDSHECADYPKMRLGQKDSIEPHVLWNDFNLPENNWLLNEYRNRVELSEEEVSPGGVGTFSFWAPVPKPTTTVEEVETVVGEEGAAPTESLGEVTKEVREYTWVYDRHTFNPVVGDSWISEGAPLILKMGEPPKSEAKKISFISAKKKNFSLKDFEGEKKVYISLKDQKGYLLYGETPFHEYKVSSGAWDTPTPVGDHAVDNKQELRIGGKAPYYRMPYWMGLNTFGKFVGYGLHEVPYLGKSRETSEFYKNGLIYDLGKNVSHGCVRSGPDDARFAFEFADIGTPVYVRKDTDELLASLRTK